MKCFLLMAMLLPISICLSQTPSGKGTSTAPASKKTVGKSPARGSNQSAKQKAPQNEFSLMFEGKRVAVTISRYSKVIIENANVYFDAGNNFRMIRQVIFTAQVSLPKGYDFIAIHCVGLPEDFNLANLSASNRIKLQDASGKLWGSIGLPVRPMPFSSDSFPDLTFLVPSKNALKALYFDDSQVSINPSAIPLESELKLEGLVDDSATLRDKNTGSSTIELSDHPRPLDGD
jgi:hypothetical protein